MPTPSTAKWQRPKSEDEWEDMVLDAMRLLWHDPNAQRNGRRGQRQDGVDICGHEESQRVGAQAKNMDTLDDKTIADEIAKAEKFRPPLERFFFVISGPRDARRQEAVRLLSEKREQNGLFAVEIFFFEDVCHELSADSALVAKHWLGWTGPRGLRVVDVRVEDQKPPATVDVKLRNTGVDVCFVKEARVKILVVGVLDTIARRFSQKTVSGVYDAEFDPRIAPPYELVVPVSQVVEPNGTDRFELRLRYREDFDWSFVSTTIVQAELVLVHDEDDSKTDAQPLLFTVAPPRVILGQRSVADAETAMRAAENRAILDRMLSLVGRPSSVIERMRAAKAKAAASSPG